MLACRLGKGLALPGKAFLTGIASPPENPDRFKPNWELGLFDWELDPSRANDDRSARFAALFLIAAERDEVFCLEQLGDRDALLWLNCGPRILQTWSSNH